MIDFLRKKGQAFYLDSQIIKAVEFFLFFQFFFEGLFISVPSQPRQSVQVPTKVVECFLFFYFFYFFTCLFTLVPVEPRQYLGLYCLGWNLNRDSKVFFIFYFCFFASHFVSIMT